MTVVRYRDVIAADQQTTSWIKPRLVDASTKRLLVGNYRVPLRREVDDTGVVLITGLRYRAFVPWAGLHPGLGAQTPIVLCLLPPGGENGLRCSLHD